MNGVAVLGDRMVDRRMKGGRGTLVLTQFLTPPKRKILL
jgi:hypothetical protein